MLKCGAEAAGIKMVDEIHGDDFFFSSRRRHTRYIGDWSSDVCSSDLPRSGSAGRGPASRTATSGPPAPSPPRSEERRVGKECRYQVWASQKKKKKIYKRNRSKPKN